MVPECSILPPLMEPDLVLCRRMVKHSYESFQTLRNEGKVDDSFVMATM